MLAAGFAVGFIVALMSLAAATAAASGGKLVYHMDFNTIMPTRAAVSGALRMAAESGCDAILWETEDKVRWETCLSAMHSEAFSSDKRPSKPMIADMFN